MGADVVIAVDLGSDILGRHLTKGPRTAEPGSLIGEWVHKLQENLGGLIPAHAPGETRLPPMHDVLFSAIEIMQVRIARSRMVGEPPDVIVSPRLAHLHLLDFHRAKEAIEEGKRAVEVILHNLRAVVDHPS
jgi:NTE family protein